jgi:hypothetical protein
MTGEEHYDEAERLLDEAGAMSAKDETDPRVGHWYAAAQTHALLALVSVTAP